MAKRSQRNEALAKAQTVMVAGYDHDWSDEEIDDAIDLMVRVVERAMVNPRILRLVELGRIFKA